MSRILTRMALLVRRLDLSKGKQEWCVQKRTIPIIRELQLFNSVNVYRAPTVCGHHAGPRFEERSDRPGPSAACGLEMETSPSHRRGGICFVGTISRGEGKARRRGFSLHGVRTAVTDRDYGKNSPWETSLSATRKMPPVGVVRGWRRLPSELGGAPTCPGRRGQVRLTATGSVCRPQVVATLLSRVASCNVSPDFEGWFSKPRAEPNTSFLAIDSVAIAGLSSEGLGGALSAPRALEHQRGVLGLPWVLVWARLANTCRGNRPCRGEDVRGLPPRGRSPTCHAVKATCFVETNTFRLFLAPRSQRKSEDEFRSAL